jgi:hypothetical protein
MFWDREVRLKERPSWNLGQDAESDRAEEETLYTYILHRVGLVSIVFTRS